LDSQTIVPTETEEMHSLEHEHPSFLRHHFSSVEQQRDAAGFGMWLFLLTEIMFFGGLFTAYLIFRNWYYPAFVDGSNTLSILLGGTNTAVLISSGFAMALAVWSAEMRKRALLVATLIITTLLGIVFLGIKYVEYHEKWEARHIPGANFSIQDFVHPKDPHDIPLAPDMAEKTQIYFSLYFLMTGMHAVHMIIGIGILVFLTIRAYQGAYTSGHVMPIENFALYWHFVDIIWLFLFPLLYLISRHAT